MEKNAKLVLYKSKTLADGSHPVMVVTNEGGKRVYRSTGIGVRESDWNPKKQCLRKSASDSLYRWNKIVTAMSAIIASISNPEPEEPKQLTIGQYIENLLWEQGQKNQIGNQSVYLTARNELRHYLGFWMKEPFSAINEQLLETIATKMKERGCKDSTIHNRLRTIRAIYNRAVKDGHANASENPFAHFSLTQFKEKTMNRCISKEQVKAVIGYKLQYGDTQKTELARDVFAFAYLCGGVPFYDLCNLTKDNIVGTALTYTRQKTHQKIKIGIPDEAMGIIKRYAAKSKGYLFPILNVAVHKTEVQKRDRIKKTYSGLNRELKKIGKHLELPIPLTTYVARHSFATVLKREGVPLEIISEALGHQSMETTKVYLDSFDVEQLLDAQKKLL